MFFPHLPVDSDSLWYVDRQIKKLEQLTKLKASIQPSPASAAPVAPDDALLAEIRRHEDGDINMDYGFGAGGDSDEEMMEEIVVQSAKLPSSIQLPPEQNCKPLSSKVPGRLDNMSNLWMYSIVKDKNISGSFLSLPLWSVCVVTLSIDGAVDVLLKAFNEIVQLGEPLANSSYLLNKIGESHFHQLVRFRRLPSAP